MSDRVLTIMTLTLRRADRARNAEDAHVHPLQISCRTIHSLRTPPSQADLDFATCIAIASISAGAKQSKGSSPSSFRRDRILSISDGLTSDSITEDTNAANPGAADPLSANSSG